MMNVTVSFVVRVGFLLSSLLVQQHFSNNAGVVEAYELSKIHYEKIPLYGMELEIDICESSPSCGGLLFRPEDTGIPSIPPSTNEEIINGSPPPSISEEDETNLGPFESVVPEKWPEDIEDFEDNIPLLLDEEGNATWSKYGKVLEGDDIMIPDNDNNDAVQGERKAFLSEVEIGDDKKEEDEWIGMAKLLFVPVYYNDQHPDVFVSSKQWLIQRGSVTVSARDYKSTVILHNSNPNQMTTIEDAREFCYNHESCVAFSFPLQTEVSAGMTHLIDEIIFVTKISGFDIGDQSYVQEYESDETDMDKSPDLVQWVTHIVHDRFKLTGRVKKHINVEDVKWRDFSTTPYRPCCHAAHDLPTIEQVQEMDGLPRVSCNISRQEFHDTYEVTRTPVMLVGCDKDWPAHELWKDIPTILKRFDNSSTWEVPRSTSWGDFQNFYLQNVKGGNEGFRVFSQLYPGYNSNEIHKDYQVPKPFQGADIYKMLPSYDNVTFPPQYGPMHWFIMGSYGTGTGPHNDPHSTDAWNTLVHGHKWWIIYPKRPRVITEDETRCFVPCSDPDTAGKVNGGEEISWYSSVGRHAHKMYYGHDEAAMQVLQNPGETIYLPYGMIHSVLNMDDTIAITQNYGAVGNFNEVWKEVLVSGDEMDWKQMYYQKFNRSMRRKVRNVMWPITKQKVKNEARNLNVYQSIDHSELEHFSDDPDAGPHDHDDDDYDDDDDDEYDDGELPEGEFLTEEEFLALPPEERAQFTLYSE